MKIYISEGNRKMNKGFLIWNLPAQKTCPCSTEMCRKSCYAKKAERIYKNVSPCRQANLEAVNADMNEWKETMIQEIRKLSAKKSFNGYFRIHESGDFFTQEYLNAFIDIANEFKEIKFMGFTKSFHLNYSNVPDNMQIIMSIFPDTTLEAPQGFPKAYAGECKDMPNNTLECPGLCDNCGMCWELSRLNMNVHFHMH